MLRASEHAPLMLPGSLCSFSSSTWRCAPLCTRCVANGAIRNPTAKRPAQTQDAPTSRSAKRPPSIIRGFSLSSQNLYNVCLDWRSHNVIRRMIPRHSETRAGLNGCANAAVTPSRLQNKTSTLHLPEHLILDTPGKRDPGVNLNQKRSAPDRVTILQVSTQYGRSAKRRQHVQTCASR